MEQQIFTTPAELEKSIQSAVESQINRLVQVTTESPQVMTIKQTSEFLGLSTSTIYTYVSKRLIPYSKRNGSLFFLRDSLVKWIQEGERKTFSQLTR